MFTPGSSKTWLVLTWCKNATGVLRLLLQMKQQMVNFLRFFLALKNVSAKDSFMIFNVQHLSKHVASVRLFPSRVFPCFVMCRFKDFWTVNVVPHTVHLFSQPSLLSFLLESLRFSFLWQMFVMWFCKRHAFLNILPYWAHTSVFSTRFFIWIFKWVLRLLFCVKRLPHVTHSWGLMSVWMSWCFFKLYFNANVFPHTSHLWDFSPLWVSMCLLNFAISANPWPHSTHENGRSPRWFIKQTSACKGKIRTSICSTS